MTKLVSLIVFCLFENLSKKQIDSNDKHDLSVGESQKEKEPSGWVIHKRGNSYSFSISDFRQKVNQIYFQFILMFDMSD